MNIDTICAYISLQCTTEQNVRPGWLQAPRVTREVFHQSCANKDICVFPSERFLPGFQSSPKPLALCLSACLSHAGAALREGEHFSLGIVGREGVLAGLCV